MGESMSHYFANGDELGPVFDAAMTCRDNRNFSALTLRPEMSSRRGPTQWL
jgi:hypothetical protein